MRTKIKIFKSPFDFVPGEPCFLPDEIAYCRKLASVRDPEEQKEFWRVVIDKKCADPKYLIYQDFPLDIEKESPPLPTEVNSGSTSEPKIGSLYDKVGEIILDLKGKGIL